MLKVVIKDREAPIRNIRIIWKIVSSRVQTSKKTG